MVKQVQIAGILLALCAQWAPVAAQNVYRCGESYSNQPCAGATVVPTDDPRTAAQRAQTESAVKRDAKAAQAMEKERLQQEARPAQATIPLVPPVPVGIAAVEDRTAAKRKAKKPALFTAVEPKKPGDKKTKRAGPHQ